MIIYSVRVKSTLSSSKGTGNPSISAETKTDAGSTVTRPCITTYIAVAPDQVWFLSQSSLHWPVTVKFQWTQLEKWNYLWDFSKASQSHHVPKMYRSQHLLNNFKQLTDINFFSWEYLLHPPPATRPQHCKHLISNLSWGATISVTVGTPSKSHVQSEAFTFESPYSKITVVAFRGDYYCKIN